MTDEPGKVTDTRRVIALDALRAIAALMVFMHHMTFSGIFGPLEPLTLGASSGVFLFFTLSGYLLFEPFVRGPVALRAYFTHRFLRIMPAYVVALVGLTVLSGDTSFTSSPLTYLFFLQNYDQQLFMGFMAPAWTLVLEVVFYLSLPLIAVLLARLRPDAGRPGFALVVAGLFSLLGGWAVIVAFQGPSGLWLALQYPFMFWAFVPGMLLALVAVRRPDALRQLGSRPMALAGVAMFLVGLWTHPGYGNLLTVIGSFLIVTAAIVHRPAGRIVVVLATGGATLSYAFYLWHYDVIKWLEREGLTGWGLGGAALLVVVLVSAASWLLVERPALRLGRRLFRSSTHTRLSSTETLAPVAALPHG
jgi:peptidoglycan/LPS O-acetylase OafA/YrhL